MKTVLHTPAALHPCFDQAEPTAFCVSATANLIHSGLGICQRTKSRARFKKDGGLTTYARRSSRLTITRTEPAHGYHPSRDSKCSCDNVSERVPVIGSLHRRQTHKLTASSGSSMA